MKKLLACSLITIISLGGCNSAKQLPREIVIVPDISQSIDADAEKQMFAAIEDVASHLRRGDTLTIVPITGDAESELQGRIIHYAVPRAENRQAYDGDLRKLDAQIKDDLAGLQADAVAHPGKHTDILGSIRIAIKEFSGDAADKRLIVLSDFIQDDAQFDFRKDARLRNREEGGKLAKNLKTEIDPHPSLQMFLGRLRSREFSTLPLGRRRAIDEFWEQLTSARVNPDGPLGFARKF